MSLSAPRFQGSILDLFVVSHSGISVFPAFIDLAEHGDLPGEGILRRFCVFCLRLFLGQNGSLSAVRQDRLFGSQVFRLRHRDDFILL